MKDSSPRKGGCGFRSADEWKSALMTLPDNGFFELLRSVFGNIKTPFSKQKLMDDLFKFLSRDEIRKTIAAYIDEQDHKVIAAVALLKEPAPGEMESFFAGDLSCAELHAVILNLEERLILYRFRDEGILRLALNPVLEKILAPFVADTGPLFPCFPADGVPTESKADAPGACFTDNRILAALFAFLYDFSEEELFRTEQDPQPGVSQQRGLRKKVLDEGKKIFPALDLELAVRTLLHLELFRVEGSSLLPCGERNTGYGDLSPVERQEYWAAGVYLCLNETTDNDAGGLSRNRLRRIASIIHRFMGRMENGKLYSEITLRRLMELIEREGNGTGSVWGVRLFDDRMRLPFEPFLAALEKAGLLERVDPTEELSTNENCWKAAAAVGSIAAEKDAAVIVMDTAFSFILYPEIDFADALTLAAFCSVKDTADHKSGGTTVCFELTRESAVRGFDQGMSAAGMIELLNRLSLNRLDENLDWTLKDWENRYAGVSLHQGIVLNLAEDRHYLAKARPVANMIRRTLAPGVYLLSSGDRAEAARALRKAGVDIIARPLSDSNTEQKTESSLYGTTGSYKNSFPRLALDENTEHLKRGGDKTCGKTGAAGKADADSIKQKFRKVLENMRLAKPERDELEARIERRLILSDAQLKEASLRYEKLEARGLDYTGKSTIAKHAVEAGSLLEVSWPGARGETRQLIGLPLALEKKEGESILVIKAQVGDAEGAEETIRISLGKISHMRRIKQSIFGT